MDPVLSGLLEDNGIANIAPILMTNDVQCAQKGHSMCLRLGLGFTPGCPSGRSEATEYA